MSSKASKRTTQRQSSLGKAQRTIKALQSELGQARMATLNMRQMYRQAEQELLEAQQRLQAADTLAATIMYVTDNLSVEVPAGTLEELSELYQRVERVQGENGALIVALIPHEDIEEDEDDAVSEVSDE